MVVSTSTYLITMVGIFVFEATKLGDVVHNLFPKGSNIEQFSRRDGSVVEVRINARLTRDDLNKLISTNIHNPDLLAIDLVDEHSS